MHPNAHRARLRVPLVGLLVGLLAALAPAAATAAQRDVLVVSNNWSGTADLVDPHSFKRLMRLNVIPDEAERVAEIASDDVRTFYFQNIATLVGEGNNQYVDDGFTSPDGRYVYFSRPSFADVVAIDLRTRKIAWRVPVDGYRADHMALSKDGRRLLVSASTANVIDVIDTRQRKIVARVPSGDAPHENNFSRDGKRIFHASIGIPYTDSDDPSQDATKGKRFFQVIDARTYEVTQQTDIGKELIRYGLGTSAAVRPMAIAPDERFIYMQLSFLHGFVEYDLREQRPRRVAVLPLNEVTRDMPRTQYTQDSAHHGLSFNPRGTKLCVAGTMSDYAAIVDRRTLTPDRITRVGKTPYWSTSSADGRYCFVSVAGEDSVSVLSFRSGREVARFRVGDHPQRMRTGTIQRSFVR